MQRRLAISALAIMSASAFAAHRMRPTVHMSDLLPKMDLEQQFPKSFGAWRLDTSIPIILPSPDVQAALNVIYNQVLSRSYISDRGERIMLSVAYGGDQSDGTKIHRPENCYPGQGFVIEANKVSTVALSARQLPVRRLVARLNSRVEPITYWMIVGDKVALSSTENKLAQLQHGLHGTIADGMLIRVSSISAEIDREYRSHDRYINALFDAMQLPSRTRIFGA